MISKLTGLILKHIIHKSCIRIPRPLSKNGKAILRRVNLYDQFSYLSQLFVFHFHPCIHTRSKCSFDDTKWFRVPHSRCSFFCAWNCSGDFYLCPACGLRPFPHLNSTSHRLFLNKSFGIHLFDFKWNIRFKKNLFFKRKGKK